jgi:uncharacterized membrane protein YgaE (UPF0421/DUF939 family)
MQTLSLAATMLTSGGRSRTARRRIWAVLLALALALAAFMHVAHTHEADASAASNYCAICTTLHHDAAPPPHSATVIVCVPPVTPASAVEFAAPADAIRRAPHQPRAPPALQA